MLKVKGCLDFQCFLGQELKLIIAEIKEKLTMVNTPGGVDSLDMLAFRLISAIIISSKISAKPNKISTTDMQIFEMAAKLKNGSSIDSLIHKYGFSRRRFYLEGNKVFDQSPLQMQLTNKLEKAIVLLANSNTSISEISKKCGFSSDKYFYEIFKKKFQMTPGEYRDKNII